MEGMKQICAKELARVFCDKKMILSVFIMPVALMIVIMSVASNMAQSANEDVEAHKSVVYVENAPEGFTDFLTSADGNCLVYTEENADEMALGIESAGSTADESMSGGFMAEVKDAVTAGNVDLIIEFPENFMEEIEKYEAGSGIPQVKTYYNPSEEYSNSAYQQISGMVLEAYRQQLLSQRVADMDSLTVFTVNSDNPDMILQDEEKAGGKILGMMLPYFVTILLFAGAMGIGTDMVAGEKERGTMASLLVSPVRRSSIVLGKVFALMIISGVSAVVYVAAMVLFMPQMMGGLSGEAIGLDLTLNPGQIGMLAILLILVAFLYSAIVVMISVFAKSVKEASTYITPAYIVILMLGLSTMFTTTAPADWVYAVPVYNITLALQGILTQEITVIQYGLTLVVTLVTGGVLVAAIAKAFESEKVMAI